MSLAATVATYTGKIIIKNALMYYTFTLQVKPVVRNHIGQLKFCRWKTNLLKPSQKTLTTGLEWNKTVFLMHFTILT